MPNGVPAIKADQDPDLPRVWLVGDFAASKRGNFSVAEELGRRLEVAGFEVGVTSRRGARASRVADMVLSTWTQRRGIDVAVVDVYSGTAFVWAELVVGVLRRAGVATILVLRGGNLPHLARSAPDRVRRLFRGAAAVVALSPYLARPLAGFSNVLQVIPNPIDLTAYEHHPRTRAGPRLVWLRTFHDLYNPTLAVDVLARVSASRDDARLIMVGADKGDGSLGRARDAARSLGVADRIEFVGPVPKAAVATQLQRGDVFLNTPRIDNVPISVLEAMASGLCVVSTAVGGMMDLVTDGVDGLLVPDDDAQAMAAAVERCCADPELAMRLSTGARTAAAAFDWSAVLPRWHDLLVRSARGTRA